ncbi:MAG: YXWGXW repeat-containing protein [Deltaproteobacteria bacterium]|nr:YXWGXW repeat-containing protein [Deltaproteobacteria bacterium]
MSHVAARAVGLLAALCAAGPLGCRPRLAVPPTGPHVSDTPAPVPYPPPAAQVELVGSQPGQGQVWVDGHFVYDGGSWRWQPGRWEPGRRGWHYAPATTVRRADGVLVYYPGCWQRTSGRATSGN